jgi:hypothetical protein
MSSSHMDQGRSPQAPPSASSRSSRSAVSFRTAHSAQSGGHKSSTSVSQFLDPFGRMTKDRRGEVTIKDNKTPLRASRLASDNTAEASSPSSTVNSPRKNSQDQPQLHPAPRRTSDITTSELSPLSSPPPPTSEKPPALTEPRETRRPSAGIEDRTPRPSTPESPPRKNYDFPSSQSNISSSKSAVSSNAEHGSSSSSNLSLKHVSEYRKGSMSKANTGGIPKMRVLVVEDEVSFLFRLFSSSQVADYSLSIAGKPNDHPATTEERRSRRRRRRTRRSCRSQI